MSAPDYTQDFDDVIQAERDWLARRRTAAGRATDAPPVGLAFSGGGIRSATFNLGVYQALEARGLMQDVDYLSSVSGGGYTASCLTWLNAQKKRAPQLLEQQVDEDGGSALSWLRAHGKYLIATKGFTGWTLGASILAAVLLNLVVMLPPLLLLVGLATVEWLPLSWPAWAQPSFVGALHGHDGFALIFWAGLFALACYPPLVLAFAFLVSLRAVRTNARILRVRRWMGFSINAGVALVAVGLVPLIVALESALADQLSHGGLQFLLKGGLVGSHLLAGSFAMRHAERRAQRTGRASRELATLGLAAVLYGLLLAAYYAALATHATNAPWLLALAGLSLVLASFCDVNQISMHSYYRARLAEAFMPPIAGEADSAQRAFDLPLASITPDSGAPLPIVNTTLNVNNSPQPSHCSRGAEGFFMTPLYCGSKATGFRRTAHYREGRTCLSTAMTISGAAVDPNTQATLSRPVSFLMALLNLRLGFWIRNPSATGPERPLPWWYVFIGREMFRHGLSERRRHVHLTDGGHFENLGLYELLRRRCRHIVVCDAGADPEATFGDLGLAIQRARIDLNAQVDISVDGLALEASQALSKRPFCTGRVTYADGSVGDILYIKPMMCARLSADLYTYWRTHEEFPHQSTANQFFGEVQFDAYRELGRQLVSNIAAGDDVASVGEWIACAKAADKTPPAPIDADAQRAPAQVASIAAV